MSRVSATNFDLNIPRNLCSKLLNQKKSIEVLSVYENLCAQLDDD